MPSAAAHAASSATPGRAFGRYGLRRLLGKSDATMSWLAIDAADGSETILAMPRVPPVAPAAIDAWLARARRAARLDHPGLLPVAESAIVEHWPYIAYRRGGWLTLDEWLRDHVPPSLDEAAAWIGAVLRGLAYAHDAGISHQDLQLHHLVVDERGEIAIVALAVGGDPPEAAARQRPRVDTRSMPLDALALRDQRGLAERDVLACGVLLHRLLAGAPALGVADPAHVLTRMAPSGRDVVRLPWTTPHPVPEALRAIVNRSTANLPRLRYRSARTFLGALDGWRQDASGSATGPVALLLDRLRTVGHLPALPGLASRVLRVTGIESQRTDEIARQLLPDMALSFELLRTLNSASVQGTQVAGNGPVLTLRRVVSLVGIDGVRAAANSLRAWPGPLDDEAASAMRAAIDRVRLAGHTAQALRPAGYDAEVVYLIAVLQNLGRLLLRYHFADEAAQIEQLMQPTVVAKGDEAGAAEQPGLGESAAAYAVLGVDVDAFASAVVKHWGFGEEIGAMIRRLPADAPVRKPDTDNELLRLVASAANEVVDAFTLHAPERLGAALAQVAQRYGRILDLGPRGLHEALHEGREALAGRTPAAIAAHAEADLAPEKR